VPVAVPLAPDVTAIQVALLVAVQEQPEGVVTVRLLRPPDAGNVMLVGAIENVQRAPACVTVNVCPAMVIVAVCKLLVLLAATE
jgi:hypothetical protein